MKTKTIFKIGFCLLLAVSLAFAAFRLHPGRNRLDAHLIEARNSEIVENMVTDWESNNYMADGFSLPKEEFYSRVVRPYDEYYGLRIKIAAINKNKYDIRILGLEILEGDGKDDIYLRTLPERTVVIPAKTSEPQAIWFPAVCIDLSNEETLRLIGENMQIKLLYVDASTGIESLADADRSVLHKEWLRK